MVRKFKRSGGGSSSKYGNANAYTSIASIKPELESKNSVASAREYEKAANMLDRTLTMGLGINQPNKIRHMNNSVYSSLNDGFHRALKLLNKNSVGHLKTAYGFNEDEYETEIEPVYEQILTAFESFEEQQDSFEAEVYRSTFETLLGDVGVAAARTNNLVLRDAANFLKESFSNGVIAFYEKEGLSNPVNLASFFDNNGCLAFIDNLLPNDVELDPTNPEHNTLLLVAFDLYLSDSSNYQADPHQFNVDLQEALNRHGNLFLPPNSDQSVVRNTFDEYIPEIDSAFDENNTLQNAYDTLEVSEAELNDLLNIGSHTLDVNGVKTYHDGYKTVLEKVQKAASAFRKIENSLTRLVSSLNASLALSPAIDIDVFVGPRSRVNFMDADSNPKFIEYPTLRFRNNAELREIVRNLTFGAVATPALSNFDSVDSMAMSIARFTAERDFQMAGINNPSTKALDLAASSKIIKLDLKSKFRAGIENFGELSQKLHNVDLPLKTLTFEESLTFAIQDVLKHHPDIDANILREACQAHSIEQFDRLITKSKRMLNPQAIARLVSTLQVIYSGDYKSLDENGNQCILAISRTGFPRLQRQVNIFINGYSNYKAAIALSEIDDSNKTRSQKIQYLLGATRHATDEMNYTASIISQGTSYSDTLYQMYNANRAYSDALINSGVSYKDYEKLQNQSGYQIGRFGNYSKIGYRSRRFTRGTSKIIGKTARGTYDFVLKPITKTFVGIPFKVIDWLTGNRISNHSVNAWRYITNKKK